MEADIRVYDTVDSTNTTLEKLADEGAKEGTCVVAFCQRKGQGRSGRTFYSPAGGNLYMSLLLRPKDTEVFDMITLTAAVATVRAIKTVLCADCGIKWVNDIYRNNKKVCGIVARAGNHGSDDQYVILGIGVNIYEDADVPEDIRNRYGSVMGCGCDLAEDEAQNRALELARGIIEEFAYYYENGRSEEAVKIYRDKSIVTGKTVEYTSGNGCFTAKVLGIDEKGGIILDRDGRVRTYRDGEIRIRFNDR